MSTEGMVFNIQRYSLEDGPGVRTTVFLKGCPLRCAWCANPESQSPQPEIGWFEQRCLHCRRCEASCKNGALRIVETRVRIDRSHCDMCVRCVEACRNGALQCFGRRMDVREVLEAVRRDRDYYAVSGGGMTVSGGDIVAQPAFGIELLQQAAAEGIDVALETCALMPTDAFLELARLARHVYIDLKLASGDAHRLWTGRDNTLILQNIRALSAKKMPVIVRTPLIPGINTSRECIREAARFLREARINAIEVLPYHRLGAAKYSALNRPFTLQDLPPMSASEARATAAVYAEYDITARIVGT